MMCTNIKDVTSCLCDLWMTNCLYLLSKEIIIYHILPCAANIFNKFEKEKRQLQREDTQMRKKTSRTTTST
jgi:hypothetical protein